MNRLGPYPRQSEKDPGGGGGIAHGDEFVGATGRREGEKMMPYHRGGGGGDRVNTTDYSDGRGGHGRKQRGRPHHNRADEMNRFGDDNNGLLLGALKRSYSSSPGHHHNRCGRDHRRIRSSSRRSHRGRSHSPSRKQRKHHHRSPHHDHRRRRTREENFCRGSQSRRKSRSINRSRSNHRRERQRHNNNEREGTSRERDRYARREERHHLRRNNRRNNESHSSSRNNNGEEQNDGGGDHSSPAYIVSEDSDNYLASVGAAVVADLAGDSHGAAAVADNNRTGNNNIFARKSNLNARVGSSAAQSGSKKRGNGSSARKPSLRDDGDDNHDGECNKSRCLNRRRDRSPRRRSQSVDDSSGVFSSNSIRFPSRRSMPSHFHRHEANYDSVGDGAKQYNNEFSFNPAQSGLQLGNRFPTSQNGGEASSRSPLFGLHSASYLSPHYRFHDQHSGVDNGCDALARSGRKRKATKRGKRRHRSHSASRGSRKGSRSRSHSHGKKRGVNNNDAVYSFSDSALSSSLSIYSRKRKRRHRSHHGRNDGANFKCRSRRSHKKGGNIKHSKKKSKKKSKKHNYHHRSSSNIAATAVGGVGGEGGRGESDSSRDDTIGHFRGGPGTMVDHRYRILCDVGLGTFGRVVQCENLRQQGVTSTTTTPNGITRSTSCYHDNRHYGGDNNHREGYYHRDHHHSEHHGTVAIKIVRNVRRYHESALIEADICERVNREQSRQRKDLCARMLDRFSLPSGHYCLVFECLGMSLYDFLKMHDYRPFPMFCVRDFARQLLEALDFLHGFGLIHTDLKPENVLLSNNEVTTYRSWDGLSTKVPVSTRVKVIDFGGATYNNEKKSSIVNTRQYRAPEVILGWGWSFPSDLWSAGCIIAELYAGELLFATHDNPEHLALMERAVGPFPKELFDQSKRSSPSMNTSSSSSMLLAKECFDSRGWHKIRGVLSSRSIEHVRKTVPVEQMVLEHDRPTGLGRLLRSLLTIDPKLRAAAREALASPFFTQLG